MRKNLLDLVVVREGRPEWRTTEAGLTQVIITRDGMLSPRCGIFSAISSTSVLKWYP
jgi:hypothetical protein